MSDGRCHWSSSCSTTSRRASVSIAWEMTYSSATSAKPPVSNSATLARGGFTIRNDHNLHVLGQTDDALHQIPRQQRNPHPLARLSEKDLSDLIPAREVDQGGSHIRAFQNARLNVQIPGEVQVPLELFAVCGRQFAQVTGRLHGDGEALGAQEIAHAFGAANQHRRLRIGRRQDQNFVVLTRSNVAPMLHFMRRLAKRELSQSHQRLLPKEILQREFGFLFPVHHTTPQTMQKGARRDVRHHHFVRLLHHPVRDGLANLDSRDVQDLVVQALQMLDVHRGQDVDACVEQNINELTTLRSLRAYVGVRKFIHQADLRMPGENRVRVHLLENRPTIIDPLPRNRFQAFRLGNGVLARVRLEVADYYVHAALFELLAFLQHLVRLADARRVAHEDFELAAGHHCGKTRMSMPRERRINTSTGLPNSLDATPDRWLWPIKI